MLCAAVQKIDDIHLHTRRDDSNPGKETHLKWPEKKLPPQGNGGMLLKHLDPKVAALWQAYSEDGLARDWQAEQAGSIGLVPHDQVDKGCDGLPLQDGCIPWSGGLCTFQQPADTCHASCAQKNLSFLICVSLQSSIQLAHRLDIPHILIHAR